MKPPDYRDYLGDGLYVRWDGYQIWLFAERDGMTHEVAIDPYTMEAFDQYRKRLESALAAPATTQD